jgi:AraC-like DNA-binding protein
LSSSGRAAPAPPAPPFASAILSIGRRAAGPHLLVETHARSGPKLLWTSTATLAVTVASRDLLVPPGYGLWIPGEVEHAVAALRGGEMSIVTFAADHCPITWTEPTGVSVGPLLRELMPHAETLMFDLLTPLPARDIHVSMPADPRVRAIADQLIANPADQRELAAWADHVHAGVRTLSRLFLSETGVSFAQWRTRVRIRAAIQHLASGASVNATARAVGYRKPSAFIVAFRRATGQTPATYTHVGTPPVLSEAGLARVALPAE